MTPTTDAAVPSAEGGRPPQPGPLLTGDQVSPHPGAVYRDAFTRAAAVMRQEGLPLSAGLLEAQRDLDEEDLVRAGGDGYRAAVLADVERALMAAARQEQQEGRPAVARTVRRCAQLVAELAGDPDALPRLAHTDPPGEQED